MNTLISHIEYLLHFHDCVVVPEWGAFIIQREDACIDVKSQIISSPHVSVSFNPEIKHNDGLLVTSLSKKYSISFEQAYSLLKTAVDQLKAKFDCNNELSFGEIGFFKKENQHKVFYSNDHVINVVYGECGLKNLNFSTVSQLLSDSQENDYQSKLSGKKLILNRVVNYAASVIILLGMILTLTTPVELNLTASEQASLNLLKKQDNLIKEIENKSGELLISMPPVTSFAQVSIQEPENVENYIDKDYLNDKFFLVVASFPSEKDAQRFIKETNDNRLNYINMDGKFRVFVSSANEIESLAKTKLDLQYSGKYSDAWICKK